MMEGAGILLIAMAIGLMLISPFHLTVTRLRSALTDLPQRGPGSGDAAIWSREGPERHMRSPSPAPIRPRPAFPDQP